LLYEERFFGLGKQDFCVDSPAKGIKAAKPEMPCKTRIVLGDEYPVMGYPTEQWQMIHEAYTLTEGQC
jgi:hypothetical protein